MYIDSHCHINFPELAARMPELLAKMAENKVTHALCVSVDLPDFPQVLALAEQYPHIYASVGVHPDYVDTPEPSSSSWSNCRITRRSSRSAKPVSTISGSKGIWNGSASVFALTSKLQESRVSH
jgi:Tat protein secretion system quality control protein TatD with DNase activity